MCEEEETILCHTSVVDTGTVHLPKHFNLIAQRVKLSVFKNVFRRMKVSRWNIECHKKIQLY